MSFHRTSFSSWRHFDDDFWPFQISWRPRLRKRSVTPPMQSPKVPSASCWPTPSVARGRKGRKMEPPDGGSKEPVLKHAEPKNFKEVAKKFSDKSLGYLMSKGRFEDLAALCSAVSAHAPLPHAELLTTLLLEATIDFGWFWYYLYMFGHVWTIPL